MFEGARRSQEAIAAANQEADSSSAAAAPPSGPLRSLASDFRSGAIFGVVMGAGSLLRLAVQPIPDVEWAAAAGTMLAVVGGTWLGSGPQLARTRTATLLPTPQTPTETETERQLASREKYGQWLAALSLLAGLALVPGAAALAGGYCGAAIGLVYAIRWHQIRRREQQEGLTYWLERRGRVLVERRRVFARPTR